ncbi:copper chaperone PCu(A)C [uncultured Rhodoblastus sp.]|uniref:copper chaperone PCu(A)C n=1 Tax=uncultured Rhodoblastus sp. TaxID=543037 RepID=UPI0025D84271|nr:copper chaperone PCu(A)C [uncultured Rhodoblastus sp.]
MRAFHAALVALLLLPSPSNSEIRLEHAWAQASPPKAVVGRAFVTIFNKSDETEHLIGVSTEAASSAEISGIRILQNVPNMRKLFNIDIPPHSSIVFAPGSYHIILRNLRKPLVAGDRIDGELMFKNAGAIPVEFRVEAAGQTELPTR